MVENEVFGNYFSHPLHVLLINHSSSEPSKEENLEIPPLARNFNFYAIMENHKRISDNFVKMISIQFSHSFVKTLAFSTFNIKILLIR